MNTRTALLLLSMCLVATASRSQPSEMAGVGTASCKDYLSFTRESDKLVLISWTQGFMSGLNLARSTSSPKQGAREIPESDFLQALVATHCRKNINDSLGTASTKVFFLLPPADKAR